MFSRLSTRGPGTIAVGQPAQTVNCAAHHGTGCRRMRIAPLRRAGMRRARCAPECRRSACYARSACARDGIGRRSGLKIRGREAWGFESLRAHSLAAARPRARRPISVVRLNSGQAQQRRQSRHDHEHAHRQDQDVDDSAHSFHRSPFGPVLVGRLCLTEWSRKIATLCSHY